MFQEVDTGRGKRPRSMEAPPRVPVTQYRSASASVVDRRQYDEAWHSDALDAGAVAKEEDVLEADSLLLQQRYLARRSGARSSSKEETSGGRGEGGLFKPRGTAHASAQYKAKMSMDDAWRQQQLTGALGNSAAEALGYDTGAHNINEQTKRRVELVYNKSCVPAFLADSGSGSFSRQQKLVMPFKDAESDFVLNSRKGSQALVDAKQRREQKRLLKDNLDTKNTDMTRMIEGEGAKSEQDEDRVIVQRRRDPLRNASSDAEREAFKRSHEVEEAKARRNLASFSAANSETSDVQQEKNRLKKRRLELQPIRQRLPMFNERENLLKTVMLNPINVIVGETGSGKTTQIVQYLHEAGYAKYGMIGCTQPRRMATVSVAERVAEEMGSAVGATVGYSIRLEDKTSDQTEVRFMTEGVLLQEALHDPLLSKYSVIVMDEAHERSVNTDVLLGVMKDIFRNRSDFKLLVTSATMDVEKFCAFFGDVPNFKVSGRTFDVDVEYEKSPVTDYVETAVLRVMEIHLKRGPGDILVFMTGKEDVDSTCDLIREKLEQYAPRKDESDHKSTVVMGGTLEDGDEKTVEVGRTCEDLIIIPCYSTLPSHEQRRINETAPPGKRKCIVATNVAETSITIDGVVFVVDPGYMKTNLYEPNLSMNSLRVYPVSQAQAKQRLGRAGRTQRGICMRLFTRFQFENELLEVAVPEIQRRSVDSVVLLLKSIGKDDLLNFDFVDPPPEENMRHSMMHLWMLGALDSSGQLTDEGRNMADMPCEPVMAKMLLASCELGCAEEILSIIALMEVDAKSIFLLPTGREEAALNAREKFFHPESDHLTLLNIIDLFLASGSSRAWATEHFLNALTIMRALDNRVQFREKLRSLRLEIKSCEGDTDVVRKCIASAYYAQTAKRKAYGEYTTMLNHVPCFLHPTSALNTAGTFAEYVVYNDFILTTKQYMSIATAVEPEWLVEFSHGILSAIGDDLAGHKAQLAKATHKATKVVDQEKKESQSIPTREHGVKERQRQLAAKKKRSTHGM